jgi:hypothetical protein
LLPEQVLEIIFTLVTLKVLPALAPVELLLALELGLAPAGDELAEPSEPFTWISCPTCLLSFESSPCS